MIMKSIAGASRGSGKLTRASAVSAVTPTMKLRFGRLHPFLILRGCNHFSHVPMRVAGNMGGGQ